MALIVPEPRAQTRSDPQPQCISCIMTWMALGLFAACAVICYWHAWNPDGYTGPTNSPPILPPMPTNEPPDVQTNLPPMLTNATPGITVNAVEATEHLDVSTSNWVDSAGGQVTDLYRTTIQTSSSPSGPWSNAYVVTHWASAYGSTAVVEDGGGTPLMTNFALRSGNGSVTNWLPVELDRSAPQKFYRAH